ncbi:MAG: hypothetical protein J07HX5_01032 [halophilic archaeon J07HX5]|nr:MAG: hypothetical protein J07HX5_01032 [halophilic archaeon J07HX5]
MPTALTLFSSDVGTFAPVPRLGSGSLPSALGVHRRATAAWSPTASHHPLSSRFLTRTHALVLLIWVCQRDFTNPQDTIAVCAIVYFTMRWHGCVNFRYSDESRLTERSL